MNTVRLRLLGLCLLIAVLGITALLPCGARAAAKPDDTIPRIMLMGDSWPWFLTQTTLFWTYEHGSAFRDILPETGRGRWSDMPNAALPGSMITQWSTNQGGMLHDARQQLIDNPTLDIVHLGLGGNDYIRGNFHGFVYHDDGRLYQECDMDQPECQAHPVCQWQTIIFTGPPTGGTFTLTFEGQTTAPIPLGSDASVVESALAGLSTIGPGNIQVLNTTGKPTYFCEFKGVFALTAVPLMTCDGSQLTGGGVAVSGVFFNHGWKDTWGALSPAEYAFARAIGEELSKIVEYILDTRPDIRLVMTDYDYMQEGVGGADFLQANTALVSSGQIKLELMHQEQARPQYANRIFFLNTYGLMQYTFGYPCDFYEPPYGDPNFGERTPTTPPEDQYYQPMGMPGTLGTISLPGTFPDYVPWAGGDLNYPGPAIAILFNFGKKATDPEWAKDMAKGGNIHLHKLGNQVFARYAVEQYYGAWLDLPKVLSVTLATPDPQHPDQPQNPTGAQQVAFEVTFSEPVNGVDEADFTPLMHNGLANASIESVTEGKGGTTYTVTVNTGSGNGTLGLAVIDNNSITAVDDGSLLAGDVDGYYGYGGSYNVIRGYGLPMAAWPVALSLLIAGCCLRRRQR